MDAQGYLRTLQSCSDRSDPHVLAELDQRRALRARQGYPTLDADCLRPLNQQMALAMLQQYLVNELLSPLMATLPPKLRVRLAHVPVGVLPFRNVNACAMKAPNGETLIGIDVGLFAMSRFFAENQFLLSVISAAHGEGSAASHLFGAYRFIVEFYRQDGKPSYPSPPDMAVPEEAAFAVMATTAAIECFVLCHEISHVWLNHLGGETNKIAALDTASAPPVDIYRVTRAQELAADGIGLGLYLWACDKMPILEGLPPDYREAAPLTFFQLTGLVEANLGKRHKFATHPRTRCRVENALKAMIIGGANESALGLAKEICDIALTMPVLDRNRYIVAVERILRHIFGIEGL